MAVDAHNDLSAELLQRRGEAMAFSRHWLPLLRQGGVSLTVCAVNVVDTGRPSETHVTVALQQIATILGAVAETDGSVVAVRDANDIRAVQADRGQIGLMIGLEGCEPLGGDPLVAPVFFELGVRCFGLTWNARNAFGCGLGEHVDDGLSRAGGKLLAVLSGLRCVVDLSHASPRTVSEALELLPPGRAFVSHAGCRAVYDTPRNLSDDQLRAVADHGGVLGVLGHPVGVDTREPTVGRMIDHIDHAVDIMGRDRVGIGPDFFRRVARARKLAAGEAGLPAQLQPDAVIDGFEGPEAYPNLAARLRERGYGEDSVAAICGTNLLEFLAAAL
jgi:membrane dipeptidase